MNNHQTQFLEDPLPAACPDTFRVAILYETAADGVRAKLFSDQVSARVADGLGVSILLDVWSFKVLGIPEILRLASAAAATADLVILSVTDTQSLAWQLRNWITMWSGLVKGRHPFMVALFANPVGGTAPVPDELRGAAKREGIDLYTLADDGMDGRPRCEKCCAAWSAAPAAAADHRVLVVDDDHYSSVLAGKMLERLGYQADFAADGAEALDAFVPGMYSAILMDVTMPLMDGLDATKRIRNIEAVAGGHVPIIAMTANVMPGDRERCQASGMDEFLSKPFHKADLAERVASSQSNCFGSEQREPDRDLEETI
jgi:CheY-like chemotaxis protein